MSSTNVTFATSEITIPANSSKKYGNKNSSPLNYYSSSVSLKADQNDHGSAFVRVSNGWRVIDGDYWTGPEFWVTNTADVEVTCHLQVISVGPDSSSIEIEEVTNEAVLAS